MAEAADLEAGLVAWLKADVDLAALVGALVFGGEMPAREAANMPRKALVLKGSGGVSITGHSNALHDSQRVDLHGFGETPHEAARVIRTAALAMRKIDRVVSAGVLLHWANTAGGATANCTGCAVRPAWPSPAPTSPTSR